MVEEKKIKKLQAVIAQKQEIANVKEVVTVDPKWLDVIALPQGCVAVLATANVSHSVLGSPLLTLRLKLGTMA